MILKNKDIERLFSCSRPTAIKRRKEILSARGKDSRASLSVFDVAFWFSVDPLEIEKRLK